MKTIKKIIVLALAILMLVSVTGCGNDKKEISLKDFKEATHLDSLTTSDGKIDYTDDNLSIQGSVDGDNIETVTITRTDIKSSLLESKEDVISLFDGVMSGSIKMGDFSTSFVINDLMGVYNLLYPNLEEDPDDILEKIADHIADEKTVTFDGWNVSVDVKDTSVIIKID